MRLRPAGFLSLALVGEALVLDIFGETRSFGLAGLLRLAVVLDAALLGLLRKARGVGAGSLLLGFDAGALLGGALVRGAARFRLLPRGLLHLGLVLGALVDGGLTALGLALGFRARLLGLGFFLGFRLLGGLGALGILRARKLLGERVRGAVVCGNSGAGG